MTDHFPPERGAAPRTCEQCGDEMTFVGTLPRVGERSPVLVYKCNKCRRVASEVVDPGR